MYKSGNKVRIVNLNKTFIDTKKYKVFLNSIVTLKSESPGNTGLWHIEESSICFWESEFELAKETTKDGNRQTLIEPLLFCRKCKIQTVRYDDGCVCPRCENIYCFTLTATKSIAQEEKVTMKYRMKKTERPLEFIKLAHLISIPEPNAIPEELLQWFVKKWGKQVSVNTFLNTIELLDSAISGYIIPWFLKVGIIEPVPVEGESEGDTEIHAGEFWYYDKININNPMQFIGLIGNKLKFKTSEGLLPEYTIEHLGKLIKKYKDQDLAKKAFDILEQLHKSEQ